MADIFGGLDLNLFRFEMQGGTIPVYNESYEWLMGDSVNYYLSSSSFDNSSDLIDIFYYVLREDLNSTSTGQFYGYRSINNYGDTECNVEFYYYAIPIEGETQFIGNCTFSCPANTSQSFTDNNLNTLYLTSDRYQSMKVEIVVRSGSNFNFEYKVVPSNNWTAQQVENFYSQGYSSELILDLSNNAYDRGFNDGLSEGYVDAYDEGYEDGYNQGYSDGLVDDSDVTTAYNQGYQNGSQIGYKNGYKVGFEEGYQDKEFTNNIFPNTFDLIGKGFEPITQVLVTEIAPNTTIGSIAFIPVSVAIVIFLLRSLIL